MRNRLTFANVIGVLLENKKKTYPQHQLVRSLFSAYLDDTLTASELIADDTTMYSHLFFPIFHLIPQGIDH